jgi:hypothetical protein
MPKKSSPKGRRSVSTKKPKSGGIKDLPMKGKHVAGADAVVGGLGTLNFGKISVEYKPQKLY